MKKGKKSNKRKLGVVALKHKLVIDNMKKKVRKGAKVTKKQAMIDAGYSESYASSGNLRKKKTWQQLMDIYLPEDLLATRHNELLNFKKLDYMLFNPEIKDEDIYALLEAVGAVPKKIIHGIQGTHVYFWQPDGKIRKDATELAYKIRGKMAPEKLEIEQTGLRSMTDQELADHIKKLKSRFNKTD